MREGPVRESGHYVGLWCQPSGVKCLSSVWAFQKGVTIIHIHFSTSSFYITALELINVSVQFRISTTFTCWGFHFLCLFRYFCSRYRFSRTIHSPRNADKLRDLISLLVHFCFFICVLVIGRVSSDRDDLASVGGRLEGNRDPEQLWKMERQGDCLAKQWCTQPASCKAPVSTMVSLTSALCGLVLGEVP